MKKSMYFLFLVVPMLSLIGCGYHKNTMAEKSSRVIDRSEIAEMIQKAQPLIEEISGRTFKAPVIFESAEKEDLKETLAEESRPFLEKLMRDSDKDTIDRQVESDAVLSSLSLFGLYSPLKKTLFVVPDNIKSISKMLGGEEKDLEDYIFLVVAHEMVHMLDDQWFDLHRIQESMEDAESLNAFAALREGHAVYVTNKIAERLHLSKKAETIATKSADGITDKNLRLQSQQFYNIYIKGSAFVDALIRAKGPEGVSAAFASPPKTTREVISPDKYLAASPASTIDCLQLLQKATGKLSTDGMQTQTSTLGTMGIGAVLISGGVSEEESNAVAAECISGAVFSAVKRALKPKSLIAMALNFTNPTVAAKMIEYSRKNDNSTEAQTNARLNSSYTVVRDETVPLDGFDLLRYRQIEKKTDGVITTELSLEGYSDTLFIAVNCTNMESNFSEKELTEFMLSVKKGL